MIKRQRHKQKHTPEHYLETIILKLDRVEAEIELVKTVMAGYGKQTDLLSSRIGRVEGRG